MLRFAWDDIPCFGNSVVKEFQAIISLMFLLSCSARLIYEDNENALFSVTLFKKVVEEFKHHAREKK